MDAQLTPLKIVEELNKYIIGQDNAKRAVAVALRNRWRRLNAPTDIRHDIMPNNILMIGNTGVGKTEIARRLAQLAGAPFIKVEASKFTEVGYVGRDVESMVRDLAEQSVNLVKAERKAENRQKAEQSVEERLLDLLLPHKKADKSTEPGGPMGMMFPGFHPAPGKEESDAAPHLPPTAQQREEEATYHRTREKFREMLRAGELDERTVEIEVTVSGPNVQVMGPMGSGDMEGLGEMLQQMIPKKRKMRRLRVAEARDYLMDEEAERLLDMEAVVRDALDRAANAGIIFIDEIDKVAAKRGGGGSGPDVSREGVQRDMLPIVEGSTVNTKYGAIKTDHVLFIAAGAFHVAKPSDLIPELQGRFPIRVELSPLTREDFIKILSQPKNALTKQYQALLAAEGVQLEFLPETIEAIADIAFQVNSEVENIGARRLHTILSNLLEEILFQVPDQNTATTFRITPDQVRERVGRLAQRKEMSEYIL